MTQKLLEDFNALPAEAQRQVADFIGALGKRNDETFGDDHGISPQQVAELRAALAPFEDWNEPEMSIYNHYKTTQKPCKNAA